MFTLTIHLQSDDLALLEPLAKHLGHIEVAIDSPPEAFAKPRQPHPAVVAIDEAEREIARLERSRAQRERDRKKAERTAQRQLSPHVIAAVACPTCGAHRGDPCHSPDNLTSFGRTGHTHIARRKAYATQQKETQK